MDIRQLKLFCLIVERGSFSLAAGEMGITQPAASQQIRGLERELGALLLDRSRRTVTPTDAGRALYAPAREMLALHEQAITGIADLNDLLAGEVTIGASTGPGDHVLPALLARFKALHPGVHLALHVDDTQAVIEEVTARRLDLGAVGAPVERPDLILEPLAPDRALLVCGRDHPWATRESVTLDELAKEPFIIQQRGAGLRSVVEGRLRAAGLDPARMNVFLEMGLMESAKQAAVAGGGVTFLSIWAVTPELGSGALVPVRVDGLDIRRDFYTVRARTRVLSRAAEALLEFLREQYSQAALEDDLLE
jgi:DNA-binding transcriptional LysR family regulator